MRLRFAFRSLLSAIAAGCIFAGANAAVAQPRGTHHAPWNSPVAWSQTIHVSGASIRVDVAPGALDVDHAQVIQWVRIAAQAVSEYYGGFPVHRARVLVIPIADRHGILSGTTWGGVDRFPAFSRMRLGEHTTNQDLVNDWTMTHEFVHTALPSLSRDHHWLEEGLATYVEPIARAQIGTLTPEFVWRETVQGMRQGEPGPGDQGLDQTHTWANTYWGGALFCMIADIRIREATDNRKGLQDALQGILKAGGSIITEWPIDKVLAAGDRATGTPVLSDLYGEMGNRSFAPIDLDSLWKRLGIEVQNNRVIFNRLAPLANIREAITEPRSAH